jgi:hypothetical protein
VLDAGAGEGRFRKYFASQRHGALDNRRRDPAWNYSGLQVVGDMLDLPLWQGSYDALLNLVVLEYTGDPSPRGGLWHALLEAYQRLIERGSVGWVKRLAGKAGEKGARLLDLGSTPCSMCSSCF